MVLIFNFSDHDLSTGPAESKPNHSKCYERLNHEIISFIVFESCLEPIIVHKPGPHRLAICGQ